MMTHEPDILCGMAEIAILRREYKVAKAHLAEADLVAQRCESRLKKADVHSLLAHLSVLTKAFAEAKHHAEEALQLALCDGPGGSYNYEPIRRKAVGLLAELQRDISTRR